MNKIYIFNETNKDLKKEQKLIKKVLKQVLKKEQVKKSETNVILVNNAKIREINKSYRDKDTVTDVISFALEDNKFIETVPRILGDIYISTDKAYEQSIEYNHTFQREIVFLAVHGIYHLLGFDHDTKEKEKIMFAKQEEVLNKNGIIR